MELTKYDVNLILSALDNDKVGSWGDGRKERIEALMEKIKRQNRESANA
jgi:hypothetical protein